MLGGPAGFKNKMKSQEVRQSLRDKKNIEEPGKKAKDEDLRFILLLIGRIKHELSIYDESYGNITATEEAILECFERTG